MNLLFTGKAALDLCAVLLLVAFAIITEVKVCAVGTFVGLDTCAHGLLQLIHLVTLVHVFLILIIIISVTASAKFLATFRAMLTAKHGMNLLFAGRAALDLNAVYLLVALTIITEVVAARSIAI
jgi:hypothetical protein